jgi:hypothetical protein
MNNDLEYKIARMDLRPGDILVVKSQHTLSYETVVRIQSDFERVAPGHKIMVVDKSLDLSILTAAEIEKRAAGEVLPAEPVDVPMPLVKPTLGPSTHASNQRET